MTDLLRVGVIGLGRRWRKRYKPALGALRQRFAVRAVCDQVRERAQREPITVKKGGRPYAVILGTEEYERLQALEDHYWARLAMFF